MEKYTYDENDIRVACLHLSCGRCIFVPRKVLGINDGNYRVKSKVIACLSLKLMDLERQCSRKSGSSDSMTSEYQARGIWVNLRAFNDYSVRAVFV
jgi:hypothetical protein